MQRMLSLQVLWGLLRAAISARYISSSSDGTERSRNSSSVGIMRSLRAAGGRGVASAAAVLASGAFESSAPRGAHRLSVDDSLEESNQVRTFAKSRVWWPLCLLSRRAVRLIYVFVSRVGRAYAGIVFGASATEPVQPRRAPATPHTVEPPGARLVGLGRGASPR